MELGLSSGPETLPAGKPGRDNASRPATISSSLSKEPIQAAVAAEMISMAKNIINETSWISQGCNPGGFHGVNGLETFEPS